jgi:hypothetical protein
VITIPTTTNQIGSIVIINVDSFENEIQCWKWNYLNLTFTWCWTTMLINIQNNTMPYKSQSFDEIEILQCMSC